MISSVDRVLTDRFARQHDELPEADFADVRRRARRLSPDPPGISPRWRLSWRLPTRVVLVVAVIAIAAVGAATAFAVHKLTQSPVTQGFSALDDPSLPAAPASVRNLDPGVYVTKEVGDGLYLGSHGNNLCAVAVHGFGGCTSQIDGDVWFQGDEGREYDAETAPFQVHLYGFARDDVASVRVTTADGKTVTLPVVHNAFQTTLKNTTFAEITAMEVVYNSGQTTNVDPSKYYPAMPPTLTTITPTGTTIVTQTNSRSRP
jgi:hypothetical protein